MNITNKIRSPLRVALEFAHRVGKILESVASHMARQNLMAALLGWLTVWMEMSAELQNRSKLFTAIHCQQRPKLNSAFLRKREAKSVRCRARKNIEPPDAFFGQMIVKSYADFSAISILSNLQGE